VNTFQIEEMYTDRCWVRIGLPIILSSMRVEGPDMALHRLRCWVRIETEELLEQET